MRVPDEQYEKIREQAARQGVSIDQYLLYTITRTVSAGETRMFFARRSEGGDVEKALGLLDRVPDRKPDRESDEMPRRTARSARATTR